MKYFDYKCFPIILITSGINNVLQICNRNNQQDTEVNIEQLVNFMNVFDIFYECVYWPGVFIFSATQSVSTSV